MVGSIFNHLVTAFDIIPDSTSINICTNHPSTCVLTGKIRIISKRPFVYKSLTLTAKGTTCVLHRHGPRSMKGKQAFLHASKDIIYERPFQRSRRDSLSPLSSPIHDPVRISDHIEPTNVISNSPPRDSSISSDGSSLREGSILHQSPPPFEPEEQSPASPSETVAAVSQNQIEEGVNDIDFRIEFPSHHALNSQQHPNNQGNSSDLFSLPSGPVKTTGGRSTINYSLNASLIVSRKDILVNNQMSVSIPFQVQSWQDMIDRNHNDDSSYHGRRHDKIEFQFQVPKQLDLHRLGDLQFGFTAKWRTLKDHIKVKEVQYYIIGEEQQKFADRVTPVVHTEVISTSATYDFSRSQVQTNSWSHISSSRPLRILQPNMVHETTSTPWPHILNISYKLRVLIRFDQVLSKERQLQLSFPISIHPTLSANGSPVHPQPFYLNSDSTNRRMMRRALYGVGSRSDQNDDDEYIDEEDYPLPIYGNREDSLLLMVEQDIQEAGLQVDALGVSMGINILDQGMLRSPSESSAYFSSSAPNTPESINSSSINSPSFPFVTGSVSEELQQQQDQHPLSRSVSLTPVSPMNPFNLHIEPRRHSTIEQINSFLYPPPYIMPILSEDRSDEAVVTSTSGRLNEGFMPEDISSTEQEIHDHEHSVEPEGESGTEEIMRVVSPETVRTSVHFSLPTPPYEA